MSNVMSRRNQKIPRIARYEAKGRLTPKAHKRSEKFGLVKRMKKESDA